MRYETQTVLRPEEVVSLAREFFEGELGLHEQPNSTPAITTFVGGGGGIALSAEAHDQSTTVELLAREWDYQARQFLRRVRGGA